MFLTKPNQEDLTVLHTLMKTGKVTPVIDRHYSLSEVPEAIRYLEAGHARGKVVITIGGGSTTWPRADRFRSPHRLVDLLGKGHLGEGLLKELDAFVEHPAVRDDVGGIPGRE